MGFVTSVGTVQVNWDYNGLGAGSDPNSVFNTTCQFKVVVVSPAAMVSNPNVNWQNYTEVKRTFDLKD